jgi:hypothetical protein
MNGVPSDGPNAKGLSHKQCVYRVDAQKLVTKEFLASLKGLVTLSGVPK